MHFVYELNLSEFGHSRHQQIAEEGTTLVVGRGYGEAQLLINNDKVSRRHLSLLFQGGKVHISDLGSSNGSYLDDKRLQPSKSYSMQASQKIYLLEDKSICIEVAIRKETDTDRRAQSTTQPPGLLAILQQKREILIGRSNDCDIIINDQAVSRHHAKVFMDKDKVYVQDLRSINGIFLNNQKIRGTALLGEQDTLYIGLHVLRLGHAAVDLSREHAIVTHDIVKVFGNGTIGLQATNTQIAYQTMNALMGPSGCGKSTLLKALNGDAPITQGTVKIFGLDMAEHFGMLKHINYLLSKILVLLFISAIQITILQSLFYLKFNDLEAFHSTWAFLLLVSLCAIQFGLLLSVITSTTEEVMSLLPIALMPQIILAGVIQSIENHITMLLSYFTLGRWGPEGAARIQDFGDEEKHFMKLLEKHLYSDDINSIFPIDGFEENLICLVSLLSLMVGVVYGILASKLKN